MTRIALLSIALYAFGHEALRDVPPRAVGEVLAEFHQDVNSMARGLIGASSHPASPMLQRVIAQLPRA